MSLNSGIEQTIVGDTLDECRQKLYAMYGKDYNIIKRESKFFRTGFFGLRQTERQVVTYTVNNKKAYDSNLYRDRDEEERRLEENRQAILMTNQSQNLLMNNLTSKIDELQKQVAQINTNVTNVTNEVPESIRKIEELLEMNEFTPSYIRMIEEKIRSTFRIDQQDDFKLIERYVIDWIGESIEIAPEPVVRPPHVIIIVGPTGVGKTTTIAKLASNTILDAKNKNLPRPELCIVTIDTMRVGAQEQLKKFGDILGKSVLKAESSADVKEIYDQYREHVDYIFIDTSGYSPNDATHISEMKNMLDVKMNPDVYLSVCASTKSSDLQNIFRNYEPFAYESVIVTKCDETKQLGNVISVLWDRHKKISYITDGQRVPRNIHRASVVEILMNLSGFNIDRVHIEDKFGAVEQFIK
ncbi:MAG: hypothetical protein MJ162_02085 [Treponema sp.]|nr:hypothetical protein [Treponema sp.]